MPNTLLQLHLNSIENTFVEAPTVAFFDLDKTLIAGYSIVAMAWERIRYGVSRGELRQSMQILRDVIRQKNENSGGKSAGSYQRLVRRLSKSLEGI